MKINKGKFLMISVSLFIILVVTNYQSLENAKNSCEKGDKTPEVEQDIMAINWTVSCK
ncbi:hypothetical protein [Ureibacillus sp. GCM10028918]|uniref:hypothetical protein n=1 Tax=Ureibacillus sp. GCM10028918 TaxID=3273429 RepID=UPI00361A61A1